MITELDFQGPLEVVYMPCGPGGTRRPGHRGYPTNGVFDGLCSECEAEMSEADEREYHEDCDEDDREVHGCGGLQRV